MDDWKGFATGIAYALGSLATFAYLVFFAPGHFNAWNWIVVLPIDAFQAGIWPICWGLLHWLL